MSTSVAFHTDLTSERYESLHKLRKSSSTMDRIQNKWFSSFAPSQLGWPEKIRVLSIGSGEGDLDMVWIRILHDAGFHIAEYHAVEPLDEHIGPLQDHLEKTLPEARVVVHQATVETVDLKDNTFDLIHAVHCVHWFEDPVASIKKLSTKLTSCGEFVSILQSEKGVPRLYPFMERFKGNISGSLTTETLRRQLGESADPLPHAVEYVSSTLDVTEICKDTDVGKDLASFLLSFPMNRLSDADWHDFSASVKSIASLDEARFVVDEPFGVIRVFGKGVTPTP